MELQENKKWLIFLLVTLFSLWFGGDLRREIHSIRGEDPIVFYDFYVYYTAAMVARSDTDKRLYSYKEVQEPNNPSEKIVVNPQLQPPEPDTTFGHFAQNKSDLQYLYPPFFSLTIVPLTYLPSEKAGILWQVFIFLSAWAAVFITVGLLYRDYLTIAVFGGIVLIIMESTDPMQDLLHTSNISSIILLLIAIGLYLHKKYPRFGALFFALAVIIKLTPIVVVPLMLIRGQWKWLTAFCCWSILLWGISIWQLGWQNHYEFFTRVMPAMSNGIPHRDNRSLSTALYAVEAGKFLSFEEIRQGEYTFPAKFPVLLFKLLAVITFIGLLAFFLCATKKDSQLRIEVLLLLLWSIIFSPVSMRYNYVLALSPIIFAWLHPSTKKASSFWLGLLSVSTFMIFSFLPTYIFFLTESFPLHFLGFLVMPAGIVFCIVYLMMILKSQPETSYEA